MSSAGPVEGRIRRQVPVGDAKVRVQSTLAGDDFG